MKAKRQLAAAAACVLTVTGMPLSVISAEESGIVIADDGRAQYIQDGTVFTGKFSVTPDILIGDTDTSGVLDALDAAGLLWAAADATAQGVPVGEVLLSLGSCETPEAAFAYADCNRDGAVDANDAAVLLLQLAEIGAGNQPDPLGYAMYYADEEGYLQTGWVTDDEAVYYAGEDYALCTGWQTIDGARYYFERSGAALQEVLQKIDGKYYYFLCGGEALCSSWLDTDAGRYYFGENGAALTGLQQIDGATCYFSSEGIAQTGWQTVQGAQYYFAADGGALCGWQELDGERYYFSESGVMQTDFLELDGAKYYFGHDGAMRTGWVNLNGITYYFGEEGAAYTGWLVYDDMTYYFNAAGEMQTGMKNIGEQRYYFSETGVMQTGFITYKDNLYYFQADGTAVTGWQELEGNTYYFRKSNYTAVRGIGTIGGVKYYFLPETGILYKNGTHGGVTTDENGAVLKVLLGTQYISQIGYPTGCESASAVMLLRDAGYDTSIDTFIDEALDIGWLSWENGKLYGPHPSEAFIGDPRSSSGYGCYAPVILEALGDILTDGDTAADLTGTDLDTLCSRYIDRGEPVAVWATINMVESTPGTQWTIRSTGESFTWKRSEHCLVLVGYDADYYYLNDPYKGNGLMAYDRDVFEDRFEYMGSQSVVIVEAE